MTTHYRTCLACLLLVLCCPTALHGQAGTVYERGFVHDGVERFYLLYVPNGYDGQEAWPLVIDYHGFRINGAFQKMLDRMDAAADAAGFLIAYPNGLIVDDPLDGSPSTGWNFDGLISQTDDLDFTDELIDHVMEDYMVDPERIHATGYSMGMQMSWSLACRLSERIASVAGVAGPMDDASIEACNPTRPVSVLLFHGTSDPLFPPDGVEASRHVFSSPHETPGFWARHNHCSPDSVVTELPNENTNDRSTVTRIEYQECDNEVEVRYYQINGGGHTWPNSAPLLPDFLGPVNRDLDASTEILAFFARNPMPEAREGRVEERSFMHDGVERSYLLYIPSAYDGGEEWPLVINYHGFNNSAQDQMGTSQMNAVADAADFLVAYPQGLLVNNPFLNVPGPGWNLAGGTLSENDDIDFSRALILHIDQDFMIDPARIHLTGYSMGAGMAYDVACTFPNTIASLAAVAEQMDDDAMDACVPGRAMSFLQVHGTADPIIPFDGTEAGGIVFPPAPETASFWADVSNCASNSSVTEMEDEVAEDNSTVTLIEYSDCDADTEVLLYQVNDGGHTWPGGAPLPEFLGPVNRDINASAEILAFFSRNPHPSLSTSIDPDEPVLVEEGIQVVAYPNPFVERLTLDLTLPRVASVKLTLVNILGQQVATLTERTLPAGQHRLTWQDDGQSLAPGLYFLRLQSGSEHVTKPILYLAH